MQSIKRYTHDIILPNFTVCSYGISNMEAIILSIYWLSNIPFQAIYLEKECLKGAWHNPLEGTQTKWRLFLFHHFQSKLDPGHCRVVLLHCCDSVYFYCTTKLNDLPTTCNTFNGYDEHFSSCNTLAWLLITWPHYHKGAVPKESYKVYRSCFSQSSSYLGYFSQKWLPFRTTHNI